MKATRVELPPHVYATSAAAYRDLSQRNRNQSILVSGESGAGKTETVKILMGHCAYIASKQGDRTIDKLLKASPLLESFGNAKTVRNDNSSRFGKFSQLEFDISGCLVGSKCITYLLEKSRVVSQNPNERNYHVFYQLMSCPLPIRTQLSLDHKECRDFCYTNAGDVDLTVIEGMSDSDRFQSTVDALTLLGISEALRLSLLQALSGILFLGEVLFSCAATDEDAATLDLQDPDRETSTMACCRLLGVNITAFSSALVTRNIDVEGSRLPVPLTLEQASGGRDALAKELYARVFQWLVLVINFNTSFRGSASINKSPRSECDNESPCGTISLLDIFGFESFQGFSSHFF